MFGQLKAFLTGADGTESAPAGTDDDLAAAAAAILVETAMLDGEFDDQERSVIHAILVERFGLSDADAQAAIDTVADKAIQPNALYAASQVIKARFSEEQRIDMLQMLWRVAYADGTLHDYEANLVRRVAGLLYVPDRDSGKARKRALAELGLDEAE
jgi:uncharacterized tellurite resistance protein B-like protein